MKTLLLASILLASSPLTPPAFAGDEIIGSKIVCEALNGGETLVIQANRRLPGTFDHRPESIQIPVRISSSLSETVLDALLQTSFAGTMHFRADVKNAQRRPVLSFHWEDFGTGSLQRVSEIQLLDGKCHIE